MNIELVKSKKLTYIILLLYVSYGMYIMITKKKIEHSYMIISFFMFFKIIVFFSISSDPAITTNGIFFLFA